ncbi:MAG TPA: hypothetical protein VG711_03035 [Phycisphaerales bacterium]|nr:hypothetical protein [Phycisphaerales bacterium]
MNECAKCGYSLFRLGTLICPECGFLNDPANINELRHKRKLRRTFLLSIGAVLTISTCCLLFTPLSTVLNVLGIPYGYSGELNRIKSKVAAIPGVTITDVRANYDTTLEEFTIDVLIDGHINASVYFPDCSYLKRSAILAHWREVDLPAIRAGSSAPSTQPLQ